jgi:hypothetical protein
MRRSWTTMSVLLWACASGQGPEASTAIQAAEAEQQTEQASLAPRQTGSPAAEGTPKARGTSKAKTSSTDAACTPLANVEPKLLSSDSSASDSADTGRALIFDIAGIALELPACTPEADVRVITVSWDTKDRPSAARIHPKFTRHGATLRVSQAISALAQAPLLVRLHSKRELAKVGEKLVLAVESSAECDAQHRDKLDDGDCSHWQLFDATFDAGRNEMVASIPATGGYRLQFGWIPAR